MRYIFHIFIFSFYFISSIFAGVGDIDNTYDGGKISGGDIELEKSSPEIILDNTTGGDAVDSRSCKITAHGRNSLNERSTLGWLRFSHNGGLTDQKGKMNIAFNTGAQNDSPTEPVEIDSSGNFRTTGSIEAVDHKVNGNGTIIFEGSIEDKYETTLTVENPTADRTITLPNESGTVALSAGGSGDFVNKDGTTDLTGDWTISTNNITLTSGTLTAEQLTSTDDISATDTITGANINGTTSLQLNGTNINTGGTLSNVGYLNANQTWSGVNTFTNLMDTGTIRAVTRTAPSSGAGLEMYYYTPSARGFFLCYDITGAARKPINIESSEVLFAMNSANQTARFTNTGLMLGLSVGSVNRLDVDGGCVIGDTYAGVSTAPTNGLGVEGSIGIGLVTPQNKLDVEGAAVIGATYSGTNTAPTNGLLVEGNVGLGTNSPQNKLDVEGAVVIGATYSGTSTAPAHGLLVEGNVGLGTDDPKFNIDVKRNFRLIDPHFVDECFAGLAPQWAVRTNTGSRGSQASQSIQNGVERLTSGNQTADIYGIDWDDICTFDTNYSAAFETRIKLEQITNLEVYVGLIDSLGTSYIRIYFDASAGANWTLDCGKPGLATSDTSGIAASTNWVLLRMTVGANGSSVSYFINDTYITNFSTNLPVAGTMLQPFIEVKTEENAAHYIDVDSVKLWQLRTV